jgi:hypothetical protein
MASCRVSEVLRLFASAGLATSIVETLAASIGAGLVVGGFAGGVTGLVASRSLDQSERSALRSSYFGGAIGLLALGSDILVKRFV